MSSNSGSDGKWLKADGHEKEQTSEEWLATTHWEKKVVEGTAARDGRDYLCTTLCDMLFGLPKRLIPSRSFKITIDLEQCYECDRYEPEDGVFLLDLRGEDAGDAKDSLLIHLYEWYPPLCLNVIVGCKVHGVGDGVLQKAIVGLLDHDKDIEYKVECRGSVISIKLDGKRPKVDKLSRISILPYHDDDEELVEEDLPVADLSKYPAEDIVITAEMEAEHQAHHAKILNYKSRPLCILACDLLLGLRRPPDQQHMDEIMSKRLLTGFEMCYNSDCDKFIEGKNTVDLRGLFVEDAIRKLVKNLNQCTCSLVTPSEFLRVIVGCKVHGVGEGRLKQALIDALTLRDIEFDKNDTDFTISIKVDGSKNYSSLEEVFDELNYSDGDLDSDRSWSFNYEKWMGCGATPGNSKEAVPELMNSVANDVRLNMCTVFCDLLFDLPMPQYQSQDEILSEMVLGDHEKCDGDDSCKITEGNPRVCLHSRTADELINLLALHLDGWSRSPGCKKFIVGCKLHGIREKKLIQGIIDLTKPWKRVVEEKRAGSIFYIIFDGRKDRSPKEIVPVKVLKTATVSKFTEDHVAGEEFAMEVEGNSAELAEGEVCLCTALCDLTFGLPKKRTRSGSLKVLTALEQCYKNDRYEDTEDTYFIDLRGKCADEAKSMVITLLDLYHPPQNLNLIVGCKVHGVGDGKLKMTICDLLHLDKDIGWSDNWKGIVSVISIKLDGKRFPLLWELEKRFSVSNLPLKDGFISHGCASEEISSFVALRTSGGGEDDVTSVSESSATELLDDDGDVGADSINEEMKAADALKLEYESRSLCTVACDFLFGLRRPRDEDKRNKVLKSLQICYQDYRGNCLESTNTVDLRGWFVVEAIEELIKHLNLARRTSLGFLQVIVGCKIHGIGEGKLKQAIIALLDSDVDIAFNRDIDFMITIKVDGQKDYGSLREVSSFLAHSDDDFDCLRSESDKHKDDDFYTIDCELLFDHSMKSHQCRDKDMSGRVKLCGRSDGDAIKLLNLHLDCWSRASVPGCGCVNFIVGCRLYHLWEVNLRHDIKEMLKDKTNVEVEEEKGGSIILITYHSRKD